MKTEKDSKDVEAYPSKLSQMQVNEANRVELDDKPFSVFIKLEERESVDRVSGSDILPNLLEQAEMFDESVFLYGSTEEMLKIIAQKVKVEFPTLKIAGYYAPPYRELSAEEDAMITEKIRESAPDFVFVSLRNPQQKKWIAEHENKLNACLLGLGKAFKAYAFQETRLPKWLRDHLSFGWVYRLWLKPGRLWKKCMYRLHAQFDTYIYDIQ